MYATSARGSKVYLVALSLYLLGFGKDQHQAEEGSHTLPHNTVLSHLKKQHVSARQ